MVAAALPGAAYVLHLLLENIYEKVVNLQAELAYIQAHLPPLQYLSSPQPPPLYPQSHSLARPGSSSEVPSFSKLASNSNISMQFDELQLQPQQAPTESTGFCDPSENVIDNEDLHELARAFVSRCLPGVRPRPPNSP